MFADVSEAFWSLAPMSEDPCRSATERSASRRSCATGIDTGQVLGRERGIAEAAGVSRAGGGGVTGIELGAEVMAFSFATYPSGSTF
jgi:hypothetical protein